MSGRCRSCDSKMSEFEMKRKEAVTGQYVDMCNKCFKASDYNDIPVIESGETFDNLDEDIDDLDEGVFIRIDDGAFDEDSR